MKTKKALFLSFIILFSSFFILSNNNSVMSMELSLTKIGQFDECYFGYDVQVENDIAYIADAGNGFWILNVSNSANPTVLSHKLLTGVEHCVYVENDIAFVTDYTNGLIIFNVSNPSNPQQIGSFVNGNEIQVVDKENDIACIGDPHLSILNISDITLPTEIYRDDNLLTSDLIIDEDILFCLDLFQGLTILNISNPTAPVEINSWLTSSIIYRDIEIHNEIIFMASNIGLKALDISDLTNLLDLGVDSGGDPVRSIDISDNLLYMSESYENLVIHNITDINVFAEVGHYTESGIVMNSVFVANEVIYATAEYDGLVIIGSGSGSNTNGAPSAPLIFGLIGLILIYIIKNPKKRSKTRFLIA